MTLPQRALALAARAHEGQTRDLGDGETEPYVEHCRRVQASVALLCDDPEVQAAAALHDVLEDTEVSYTQIRLEFGSTVSTLVLALTDEYTPEDWPLLNRAERKHREAQRLGGYDWRVRLIKLCDVLDNAASIEAKGGGFAEVWREEKAALVPLLLRGER
jgi:(p)ppGpp synthase/HD superfamily hydrolase